MVCYKHDGGKILPWKDIRRSNVGKDSLATRPEAVIIIIPFANKTDDLFTEKEPRRARDNYLSKSARYR